MMIAMEWHAEGILLGTRRHGEQAAILDLFTANHGRHLGVLRGGASRKSAPFLQPGTQVQATWRARLDSHMGVYTVEPMRGRAAHVMHDAVALAGLAAVCALLRFALPERQAHPVLYAHSLAILDGLGAPKWAQAYVDWEMALLDETGFGLDLGQCAVTGTTEDLAYISPRTGRAVARAAAGIWSHKLLPMPRDVAQGLSVTGHFLTHHLAPALGNKPLPYARDRLAAMLVRQAGDDVTRV